MTYYKSQKTCTYPGCERPHNSKGHCSGHRKMVLDGKELRPIIDINQPRSPLSCTIENCGRKHAARGYCKYHYNRIIERGAPPEPIIVPKVYIKKTCSFKGCCKPARAKGLCPNHYQKIHRKPSTLICDMDNCDKYVKAKGLCAKHYQRLSRYGNPQVNYARRYKRTAYNINTTPLKYTHSHEEVMVLNGFFDEMINSDNSLERFE